MIMLIQIKESSWFKENFRKTEYLVIKKKFASLFSDTILFTNKKSNLVDVFQNREYIHVCVCVIIINI